MGLAGDDSPRPLFQSSSTSAWLDFQVPFKAFNSSLQVFLPIFPAFFWRTIFHFPLRNEFTPFSFKSKESVTHIVCVVIERPVLEIFILGVIDGVIFNQRS